MLLSNDELKREVLGIFSEEIYKSLREAEYQIVSEVELSKVTEETVSYSETK